MPCQLYLGVLVVLDGEVAGCRFPPQRLQDGQFAVFLEVKPALPAQEEFFLAGVVPVF